MRMILLALAVLAGACSQESDNAALERDSMTETLPYGSWPSPISAASVVEGSRGLGALQFEGEHLYWLESRPEEGGRNTIMRWAAGGEPEEVLPAPWNARTRVHEYGGGSLLAADGMIWFANLQDQRLYRLVPGEPPEPVTPKADLRFAGCVLDRSRNRLLCVREDHRLEGEPQNSLVAVPLEGLSEGEVLFSGSDFVSAPSLSADGSRIAFTSWQHPNMPWDNTTLWSAGFDAQGGLRELVEHNPQTQESVLNPQWRSDGRLFALSDRDNWWGIYEVQAETFTPIAAGLERVEIGGADWSIGKDYYHLLEDGRILARVMSAGVSSLVMIDPANSSAVPLGFASAAVYDFLPVGKRLFVISAPGESPPAIIETTLGGSLLTRIRSAGESTLDADWIPQYQLVSFPTGDGAQAHGIYLPPANPNVKAAAGTAPPLIVKVHGGPTSVSSPTYNTGILYWTSRGFAILNLNYRGSTGFGRDYRRALYGQWGIADVEDAAAGATWLAEQGLADPDQLLISGGSAGGYTALAAHAFHDAFAAGASHYGISDLEALARDTHKFESRYMDQLIGPYPEQQDIYRARSPIHHLDGFSAPLLLLQGLDDPVVPPNQSQMIFEALKSRGVATAYIAFEGESHGFRKAENQIRALEAELYFYSRVLGLDRPEALPEVDIIGLSEER
jgi:dipeptidyl aminopeptidase/acylaminoacyl peptidase